MPLSLSLLTAGVLAAADVMWISSTVDDVWKEKAVLPPSIGVTTNLTIHIKTENTLQNITGFGGCFNEMGWTTLGVLPVEEKNRILDRLFDPTNGCAFNLCRMPIGANDYAIDWYSLNETPDDFAMENFSIARDKQCLIPYIKEAQKRNPELKIWASPWCPPSWMKKSKHYACLSKPSVNDLPPEFSSSEELVSRFIMEPEYLQAYALYFSKFVKAYKAEGINLYAVHVQNEYNSAQNFPSCVWKPEDLGLFIAKYLAPQFKADRIDADIWLGTVERPQIERVDAILEYPGAGAVIKGVGFQWGGKGAIVKVHRKYPDLPLMQTESECGNGANDWAAAEHTFQLMKVYFEGGANAYLYWNMILDESGNSKWGWKQNTLISIDRQTKTVRYNPEFYLMKHLSAFVPAGSVFLSADGDTGNALTFYNAKANNVIVFICNDQTGKQGLMLDVNGTSITVELSGKSFNTLVINTLK